MIAYRFWGIWQCSQNLGVTYCPNREGHGQCGQHSLNASQTSRSRRFTGMQALDLQILKDAWKSQISKIEPSGWLTAKAEFFEQAMATYWDARKKINLKNLARDFVPFLFYGHQLILEFWILSSFLEPKTGKAMNGMTRKNCAWYRALAKKLIWMV